MSRWAQSNLKDVGYLPGRANDMSIAAKERDMILTVS